VKGAEVARRTKTADKAKVAVATQAAVTAAVTPFCVIWDAR
jgi:hypothetical protein